LEEKLSVDEHMVKFKGSNSMKQYMKGKPVSWGFKEWILAASNTGYIYLIDMYTGKDEKVGGYVLGESVVLQMTKIAEFKGCIVGIDNFFTSIPLLQQLHSVGIRAVGTIRTNRKHLPPAVKDVKKLKANEHFGFICNAKKISVCIWIDKRPVIIASNCFNPKDCVSASRRMRGQAGRIARDIPKIVVDYNETMKGVDLADQKKVTYEIDHRSPTKFYLRIFFDLLDISITNAYIVYQKIHGSNMTSLEFRRSVAMRLVANFSSRLRDTNPSSVATKRLRIGPTEIPKHLPIIKSSRQRCHHCSGRGNDCRSNVYCPDCGIFLCLNINRNCYTLYHSNQ
jgi:DNA excision repair protein ERCC-6